MINKIKILSPGKSCWKTRKIIQKMKDFTDRKKIKVDFIIITEMDEILKYKTWILPTIIINEKIVARGYKPDSKVIIKNMIQ